MYINQFDIYINGNFFVSGYLFYKFVRSLYNEKRRKEERNKKCCMKQESKVGYRDIFRQTEYMKIMIAALINRFGDSIDAIASTWIVYEITGNAAWSAIIYGVNRIPSIIITPLAGAWVEGQKKKTIMIVTDLIRAGLCCICGNRVSVRIFTGMDAAGYNFDDFYGRGIPGTGKCCIDAKGAGKRIL